MHGCVTGSFAARIPWIASHVGVDVGHLGIALLMPGIGALLAMPFSGRLAHRFALRPLVTVTIVAWSACLVLPALPTSLIALCGALLVFGAVAGLADMAMNAEGVLVEKLFGRSVMSSLHGFWERGRPGRVGRLGSRVPCRNRHPAPVRGRGARPRRGRRCSRPAADRGPRRRPTSLRRRPSRFRPGPSF